MMLLAGLLGIAGVGAASVVDFETPENADDDDRLDIPPQDLDSSNNLLEMLYDPMAEDIPELPAGVPEDDVYALLFETRGAVEDTPETHDEDAMWMGEAPADQPAAETSLADWIKQGTGAEAMDYASDRDSLVLVWDDTSGSASEPSLSVEPDPDDPEVMQVRMGDEVLADVYGDSDLQTSDIIMIPLTSAELVGLAPA